MSEETDIARKKREQTNIEPSPSRTDKEIRLRRLDFNLDRKVAGIIARITSATIFSANRKDIID